MTPHRHSLGREDGVAMIVAIGILAVLMILGATLMTTTSLVGTATKTEGLRKRAFEAAQAGLQATLYRVNMLTPDNTLCIGDADSAIRSPDSALNGWCRPYTQSLGNGTTYTSWTTPRLVSATKCAGLQVGSNSRIIERCVTADGTVGGVSRRVQARIASFAPGKVFPASFVGLRSVTLSNNSAVRGIVGSNGLIKLGNKVVPTGIELGPGAPDPSVSGNDPLSITRRTVEQGPFALAPVDPGDTATMADGNARLSNALSGTSPADVIGTGATWSAATRSLTLGNNATVVLGGAKYNFCNLTLDNGATLQLAVGARTAIYVDSPDRPGSGCPAGSGIFSLKNGSKIVNTAPPAPGASYPDPTALQIFVYGSGGNVVTFANGANFYGTIYAPRSTVQMQPSTGSQIFGAVAALDINLLNVGSFTGDAGAAGIETPNAAKQFFVTTWRECRRAADNATDPGTGC